MSRAREASALGPTRLFGQACSAVARALARAALAARRSRNRAAFVSFAAWIACLASPAEANGALRLQVRGNARIDAHAARSQGKLALSGTITDDLGAPAPGARLALQFASAPLQAPPMDLAQAAPALLSLIASAPEMCSDLAQAPVLDGDTRLLVVADASARFCLRLAVPPGRYVARLEAKESGFVDGAQLDLPVDIAREAVTLRFERFDTAGTTLSLDEPDVSIDAVASTEDDGIVTPAANLPLALSNESGLALGTGTTDATGRASFAVPGWRLGPAGRGELRIAFAGDNEAGGSSYVEEVERRTRVTLDAPDAVNGLLPIAAASSEAGVVLRVVATAACMPRGCKGWPTGTIEVRRESDPDVDGAIVGAATLEQGEARVVATFPVSDGDGSDATLRVRYLPDRPWFEPTPALALIQPLHPPSPWNRVALGLAGLLVMGWLAVGRAPGLPSRRGRAARDAEGAESPARVELVRPDAGGTGGWSGRVVDIDRGDPVAGARLTVERAGFERTEVIGEATSDSAGAFVLAPIEAQPGDRLVAEGPLHASVRLPLPPAGEIRVALVARKRALLDQLVAWARQRGKPFDATPEPTPGHIGRTARDDHGIKEWADAVERAAYSGGAVGAHQEAEVERLAPPDAPRTPHPK
jgi:hypothetical protein